MTLAEIDAMRSQVALEESGAEIDREVVLLSLLSNHNSQTQYFVCLVIFTHESSHSIQSSIYVVLRSIPEPAELAGEIQAHAHEPESQRGGGSTGA